MIPPTKWWYVNECHFYPFRDNSNFSLKTTIFIIVFLAIVLMLPYHRWYKTNFAYYVATRSWQFLIQGLIPCTAILVLTFAVNKRVNLLRSSGDFQQIEKTLKKSMVRARLQIRIAIIFVMSQFFVWIRLPYDVRYT